MVASKDKKGKMRKAAKIPTVGQTPIWNHAPIIVRWLLTITMLLALLPGMLCGANTARPAEIPPEAMALHAKLTSTVQPSVRMWIDEQAKRLSQGQMDESSLHTGIVNRFTPQPIKTGDVEAIKFLTHLQAIRYMDSDIGEMNGKLKSIEAQKRELRAKINREKAGSNVAQLKPISPPLSKGRKARTLRLDSRWSLPSKGPDRERKHRTIIGNTCHSRSDFERESRFWPIPKNWIPDKYIRV